jgi:tetratricopeptide (TPR) repeat protein
MGRGLRLATVTLPNGVVVAGSGGSKQVASWRRIPHIGVAHDQGQASTVIAPLTLQFPSDSPAATRRYELPPEVDRPQAARYVPGVTVALPLRIFLASPGDADRERSVVRRTVDEWNAKRKPGESTFEVVGWENVRGTARRPQDAINELISESHFLIAMFKRRWGSEPGGSWGYSSGTEEELFQGLLELGIADQPMRDVWIAFLHVADPEERVGELKQQLVKKHAMLFEAIDDVADLKDKLSMRLDKWDQGAATKVVRHVELISSTGAEVLRAARLRIDGQKLIELGQASAGYENLQMAADIGGPLEHLAHARHLARKGDLDAAYAAAQAAIDATRRGADGLYSPSAANAFSAQAGILRRCGDNLGAIGRLRQALTLIAEHDAYARRVRSRILDELGLALQRTGDRTGAEDAFNEALQARREDGSQVDICQSYINLARLTVETRDLAAARKYSDEALAVLRHSAPTALHANAQTLAAQVRLRQGEASSAIPHGLHALALNQQFGSANGEAIALLVLAQCHRATGDYAHAREYAEACLAINDRIGNESGAKQARWQLQAINTEVTVSRE